MGANTATVREEMKQVLDFETMLANVRQLLKFLSHYELNPYLTNGFSHHYQLDEFTFIFRGVRSDF